MPGIENQVPPNHTRRTGTEYRQVIPADKVGDIVSYQGGNAYVVVLLRVLCDDDIAACETTPSHLAIRRRCRHELQLIGDERIAVHVHLVAEADRSLVGAWISCRHC